MSVTHVVAFPNHRVREERALRRNLTLLRLHDGFDEEQSFRAAERIAHHARHIAGYYAAESIAVAMAPDIFIDWKPEHYAERAK